MEKLVFVILHYQVIEQTINCIKSIKDKLNKNNCEIVVVDNNSPNGTGKKLEDIYKNDLNVHVILNHKNLGFSRGNNVGFKYAKDNLNADFIAMINNDTCIIQEDFFEIINSEYKKSNFAVLGPKIILLNNNVNQLNMNEVTVKNVKKEMKMVSFNLLLNYLHLENIWIYIKKKLKKFVKKKVNKGADVNCRYENIILHGCCLIFSPIYIKKFDGLDDRTFLYHEEELLYLRLKENNMNSVYNPELLIFHEEDVATNSVVASESKKRRFVYKNLLKSNKILLSEVRSYLNKKIKEGSN